MRGRTNITGGGMNLNADVQEFTVVSGKNVVAGDFVEHYTTVSERVLISSSFSTSGHKQIGNGMCINISNNILYLLKQTESGLEIVDAYNEYSILSYEPLSDGSIVVCISQSPWLVRLRILEERFQYVCSANSVPNEISERHGDFYTAENGGRLYMFAWFIDVASGSGEDTREGYSFSTYLYDISQVDSILFVKTIAEKTTTSTWNYLVRNTSEKLFRNPIFCGDYLCVQTRVVQIYAMAYTTIFTISDLGIECIRQVSGDFGFSQLEEFHDKYLLYDYKQSLCVLNTSTGALSEYNLNSFGFNKAEYIIKYSKIGDDKIAVFYAGTGTSATKMKRENGVFEVNRATGGIMLSSNIFNPTFSLYNTGTSGSSNGIICIGETLNDIVYYNGIACVYAVDYNNESGILMDKIQKNYVQPYTGSPAIGVAKQSGKAGQSIEVYVAKPSE